MAIDLSARLVLQDMETSAVRRSIRKLDSHFDTGASKARAFSDAIALRGINLAGYTATTLVIAKLSESVSRATKDAIKFEYELAKIAQTTGQSNDEVREHADSIRDMSVAYGLSATKIAETLRVLAQAGYTFKQAEAAAESLAQSTLLSSFESLSDTTDGLIAINKQFTETMGDSARVIALLNNVSKKYAVESSDLVEATRKAGGIFSATGGSLEELVTVFTTVRDTTRESAETIATALRTIFSRLQRPKTIEYMREFGIELTDLKGNFIGNYEAIKAIQDGIANNKISSESTTFAGIVEAIGGIRQQSTTIPLLLKGAKMQEVWNETQRAGTETAKDLAKAQDTLSFRLSQLQQNFTKFIGEITETESFKLITNAFITLSNATLLFATSLKELLPLLAALFSYKTVVSVANVVSKGLAGRAILGTRFAKFKRGGIVPGEGKGDKIKALLEPGEFVVTTAAAQAYGYDKLGEINKMHSGGIVRRYAKGGKVHRFASGGTVEGEGSAFPTDYSDVTKALIKEVEELTKAFHAKVPIDYKSQKQGGNELDLSKIKPEKLEGLIQEAEILEQKMRKLTRAVQVDQFGTKEVPIMGSNGQPTSLKQSVSAATSDQRARSQKANETFNDFRRKFVPQLKAESANPTQYANKEQIAAEKAKTAAEAQAKAKARADAQAQAAAKAQADLDAKNAAAAQAAAKATADAQAKAAADRAAASKAQADLDAKNAADAQAAADARRKAYKTGPNYSQSNKAGNPFPGDPRSNADFQEEVQRDPFTAYGVDEPDPSESTFRKNQRQSRKQANRAAAAAAGGGGSPPNGPIFGPPSSGFQGPGYINKPALDGSSKADTSAKLGANVGGTISLITGVASALVDTYGDQDSAMTRMISTMLTLVSTVAAVQASLALFGIQLRTKAITDFGKDLFSGSKGIKNIAGRFQSFVGPAALKAGQFGSSLAAKTAGNVGVVGRAVNFLNPGKAISGGATAALSPAAANVAAVGTAALVAGAAVFGFSKIVDAALGLEEKKNKVIAEGSVAEAGKLAASQQAQEDLTKLATAVAVTASVIPVIGPVVGAIVGFGIKLAGLIPGAETVIGGMRDLGAAFGILESTALISSRSRAAAANNAVEKNRTSQQAEVTRQQKDLSTGKEAKDYFKSSTFKASVSKTTQAKTETSTLTGKLDTALTQQSQTGYIGEAVDSVASGFGLWGESIAETAERLAEESDKAREDLKAQASADFTQHSKAFTVSVDSFVAEGGTNWNEYLQSLDAGARDLLLLSGHSKELQVALAENVKRVQEEADARLFNFQLLQKTAPALLALEQASKKASAIVGFGSDAANLTSGNFQANSLTNGANSDSIKTQAAVAKSLGINNYENIVGGSTKAREDIKTATKAYESAGSSNPGAQKEFQDSLKDIILAGNPDADEKVVDKLSLPELQEAANKIANAGDEVKERLVDVATKTDQGANQLKAAFDKRIEAESALNQAVFDTVQARNSRAQDLESFKGSGTVQSDILSRRIATDESGRAESARSSLGKNAAGAAITKSRIAELQATQAGGGEINVEELKNLQSSLLVFDSAMKSATATINLDTQQRLANIDSLKESLAIEKSRTDSFKATGKKLLYGSEEEKFKEKIALRRGAKIEGQLSSGNDAGAIRSVQQASILGLDVGGITSKFSAKNQERFGIAEDTQIARLTRGGAYGSEFESIRQSDTTREGTRIVGDIAKQEQGLRGNEDAVLVAKAEEAKSAIMAADRFGSFVSQMDGSLKTFSTELSNIVGTLQNSSITMKLDTTRVDVNLGDPAMFSSLQDGLKKELMAEISRKINELTMGQGQ